MATFDDLKGLADFFGPCLTIFQPLREDNAQAANAEARIAAAIQEAGRLLTKKGLTAAEREELLRPLPALASNKDRTDHEGTLVAFRVLDFTLVSFWPDILTRRVHFAREFLILPLLPGLLSKHDFWLLGLSVKAVRLFRGSRSGLVETALPEGVPKSLSQDEDFDQPDHSLRNRSSAGRSAERELKMDHLHDFFKTIDRCIHATIAGDRQPLILAGVAREVALYRSVNTYSPLLAGAVHGSPDALGVDELYRKASALIAAYSAQAASATLREMEEAADRGLLLTDPAAVIEAARIGQVDELIVSPAAPGFDLREEMINSAALATIRKGGKITVLSADQAVGGVAAILRFQHTEESDSGMPQHTGPA